MQMRGKTMFLRRTHPRCGNEGQEKLTICSKKKGNLAAVDISAFHREAFFLQIGTKTHTLNGPTLPCERGEAAAKRILMKFN